MRATLFHNPDAGPGGHSEEELSAALRRAGLDVCYCNTKGPDFATVIEKPYGLAVARFEQPNLWDVAGGIELVREAPVASNWCGKRGRSPGPGRSRVGAV